MCGPGKKGFTDSLFFIRNSSLILNNCNKSRLPLWFFLDFQKLLIAIEEAEENFNLLQTSDTKVCTCR